MTATTANTGMTAIVGPDGRIEKVLEPFTTGVLTGEVVAHQGMTPYARFGNGPALVLMLFATLLSLFNSRRRRS